MNSIFSSADILLPKEINNPEFAKKWAVIACDQFTAEREYWDNAESEVGNAPSALNIILPEVFLDEKDKRLPVIAEKMVEYKQSVFKEYNNSMIFVRRNVGEKKRLGIVGKIDLEEYDYSVNSVSPVRATEGTVLERIPPRVAVRRNAVIESPHVMLLIDDMNNSVIKPLEQEIDKITKLYDFNLMLGGGHIEGYLLSSKIADAVCKRLDNLFSESKSSIKFAVGDGNHSLASAKARYEELKSQIGDEAKSHPLRYALCEVVNLHDEALEFEPIYRIVKTANKQNLLSALKEYGKKCGSGIQTVECIYDGKSEVIPLGSGTHMLTVGTLQKFLDSYQDIEIDYIHGLDSVKKLSNDENTIGFIFDGMKKEELFCVVERNGSLPRKTFSMGEARDKRYYIECRNITE